MKRNKSKTNKMPTDPYKRRCAETVVALKKIAKICTEMGLGPSSLDTGSPTYIILHIRALAEFEIDGMGIKI